MFQSASSLVLDDFTRAVPVTVCIMLMALTFSISEGIAMGILADLGIKMGMGRFNKIPPLEYVLGVLFGLHYVFKP